MMEKIRVVIAGYGNVGRGVLASLRNNPDMEAVGVVSRSPERVKKELLELGFHFPDSGANFIFASHESCPAKELFEALKKEDIYVRYFDAPRISNYLRITVGTDEEMNELLRFLRAYLKR